MKALPTKSVSQKALSQKALSALASCASVSLLLLSSLLVGCVGGGQTVGGQTVDEQTDELESAGVATQEIDQSAVKLETASGAHGRVVAPALTLDQVVAPLLVPQLDVVPTTNGTPVPPAEDPKSKAATPAHDGAEQMDPEPCPWSQKGPPT